jgi:hypothetical protein
MTSKTSSKTGRARKPRQPKTEASAPALVIETGAGLCGCGCKEAPRRSKSTFVQGHDARLRGILGRNAAVEVGIVSDGVMVTATGAAHLDNRGWPQPPAKKSKTSKPKAQPEPKEAVAA